MNQKKYGSQIRKFKRLAKKFGVEANEKIKNQIFVIESRGFTDMRSFKTIEPPYQTKGTDLQKTIIFSYQNIKMFIKNQRVTTYKAKGELYISKNELVLWDRSRQKIMEIIKRKDINAIILQNYGIEINEDKKTHYLRGSDDLIIFTSFERLWKKGIEFKKNKDTKLNLYHKLINRL